MGRARRGLLALLAALGAAGWFVTAPAAEDPDFAAGHRPDVENGARVFAAAGCRSCHQPPDAPESENTAPPLLSGGQAFNSDFGTFYAPNISSDPVAGLGGWSLPQFANAVTQGVSPEGQHYYPAFPYAAYQHMTEGDVADLFAYLQTLPAATAEAPAHAVPFPFNLRRGLGLWKLAFMPEDYAVTGDLAPEQARGRYLAEALAHCGECHTPRNAAGGLELQRWLAGAPNPDGKGRIPNITPAELTWSQADIVGYFTTGFTPDYDTVGAQMAEVVENLALLPPRDREALAAYLMVVPPVPDAPAEAAPAE